MTVAYDPSNQFEIKTWDTEFRKAPKRTLMARIYQPQGDGPFPTLLDLHGGAWNNQDRTANAPMDESLAKSGLLVVAIDLTRAPEALTRLRYRMQTMAFVGSKRRRGNGRATPPPSPHWEARAAATKSNSAPCARKIRAITPIRYRKLPMSTRLCPTSWRVRP